tara:strand:- start:283 stop:1773 length:1491 start_codon:yes stop_codon:yes gene_type:complete
MSNNQKASLNQLIEIRIEKLNKIKNLGYNPYPHTFDKKNNIKDIINNAEEHQEEVIKTAGRIVAFRKMGKASFIHIQDMEEKIQIYVKTDLIPLNIYDDIVRNLDIGDIIGIEGELFYTKTNELSIRASNLLLLSKSIRPLPNLKEKDGKVFFAFEDKELKYRKRYLDLIANKDVKELFIKRSLIINKIRNYLNLENFLEVETPILQPIYGGAFAKPFTTHHNSLDRKLYLRIADELYLKRLIIGGIEKVYEIGKDFRNEGIDKTHNPEFTMLEFYQAYADVYDMANLVENLFKYIVKEIELNEITFNNHLINFGKEFKRIKFYDSIEEKTNINIKNFTLEELYNFSNNNNIKLDENLSKGKVLDKLFGHIVEPYLIEPTFVFDYPLEISPLAKISREGNKNIVERFELFIGGYEIANSFTELNDPIDQRNRFSEQDKLKFNNEDEIQQTDIDFLESMEIGMPPTGGVGIGIDRLIMLLTSADSIKDVILFPTLKS